MTGNGKIKRRIFSTPPIGLRITNIRTDRA